MQRNVISKPADVYKRQVLTVSDLSLYYSKKKALNTINMTFYKNEITALIGPSGCGKSTDVYKRQE